MTMEKNRNYGFWYTVPATANMQIRKTNKLKAGLPLFVGNMLMDDSWCGLRGKYPTKSLGKNHPLTFSFRLGSFLNICSQQFQFISSRDRTVLTEELNSNKPPIRGLVSTTKNMTINH